MLSVRGPLSRNMSQHLRFHLYLLKGIRYTDILLVAHQNPQAASTRRTSVQHSDQSCNLPRGSDLSWNSTQVNIFALTCSPYLMPSSFSSQRPDQTIFPWLKEERHTKTAHAIFPVRPYDSHSVYRRHIPPARHQRHQITNVNHQAPRQMWHWHPLASRSLYFQSAEGEGGSWYSRVRVPESVCGGQHSFASFSCVPWVVGWGE